MANLSDFGLTSKPVSTRGVTTAPRVDVTSRTYTPAGSSITNVQQSRSFNTVKNGPKTNLSAGSSNYNINLDPTYSGTIGAETGYKGDPLTAGNVGPSIGQSWTGGTQRTDGTMAGGSNTSAFKSLSEQADEYARSQNPVPSPYMQGYAEAMVAYNQALQASRAEFIGRKQIEQKKSEADKIREQYAMANSAAGSAQNTPVTTNTTNVPTAPKAPATTPVNSAAAFGAANLTKRLNAMTSRQDFIEQQRAAGMSDTQIREMIRTLPPEQTGGVIPTPSTNAAGSTQAPETTSTPQAPAPTPTTPPKTEKVATTAGADSGTPPPVKIPPVASSIGEQMYQVALANGDPMAGITKAIYDDFIAKEAAAKERAAISLGESIVGAETEFTDTQSFIDKWVNIATKNSNNLTDLLQTQNEETNKVLEQQKSNALQKLEFDRQVAVQKAERQKAQDILKSSIAIGLRGGAYSGAAQNALADAEREWDNNISNLSKEFSFKAADVMTEFTSKYVTAKQNLALNLFNASEALSNKIEGYANAGFSSLQAKKKATTEARNAYRTTLDTIAKDHVKDMKEMMKEVGLRINQSRDDQRAQEQMAWNILDDAVARYGSLVPKSVIDRVSSMLPAGTDIKDYINTPTIAERNSKRISGSGGVYGGPAGVPSGSSVTAATIYANVTPQQLKEAVKRAFAPANYGGSAGERAKRENEYMSRIASGESPASIMQSLTTDYWASQKGAPRTAHDGRTEAQASAESLQFYVDTYGIESGDDGSLGAIDSRVQGLLSVFDASSEEYNNLATNVGNIRARIIKENYGAAVTPQELEIAKSYIPNMTDKGGVFTTKLQNLKSYQAYLDAKVAASALGLPMPTPPKPVTLSGDKMSGAGKYSVDDISSALIAP